MPSPTTKIALLGIGATGVVGGGTYLLIRENTKTTAPARIQSKEEENAPKSIDQLLDTTTKGKKITKTNKGEQGAIQKWKAYINENKTGGKTNEKDKLEITNWSQVKREEGTVPDTFVEACNKQLAIKVNSDQDEPFKNYISWCTIA